MLCVPLPLLPVSRRSALHTRSARASVSACNLEVASVAGTLERSKCRAVVGPPERVSEARSSCRLTATEFCSQAALGKGATLSAGRPGTCRPSSLSSLSKLTHLNSGVMAWLPLRPKRAFYGHRSCHRRAPTPPSKLATPRGQPVTHVLPQAVRGEASAPELHAVGHTGASGGLNQKRSGHPDAPQVPTLTRG